MGRIRVAALQDKETLRSLLRAHLAELGAPSEYPYLDSYWTDPARRPYVVEANGEVVGFALTRALEGGALEMAEFYIAPSFRRRGIGRRMATAVLSERRGKWRIPVPRDNLTAFTFWSSLMPSKPTHARSHLLFEYIAE